MIEPEPLHTTFHTDHLGAGTVGDVPDRLDLLLDILVLHFAGRRDTLDVIGRFGNRFEDWFKWESAVAFHVGSFTSLSTEIELVAAEREDCDLFIGGNSWPKTGGYPAAHDNDVWLELKARSTADKGPGELVADLIRDDGKLAARQRSGAKGKFASLALIVSHHRRGDIDSWLDALRANNWLSKVRGAAAAPPRERVLWEDARNAETDRKLAALVLWER
jgi:hypothetical protein